jgi:MHS family proline/betaine transporter-like MFS transporter
VLSADAMGDWGWRVLFFIGGVLGPIGMYMRAHLPETPAYQRSVVQAASSTESPAPIGSALKTIGIMPIWSVSFYMFFVFLPIFARTYGNFTPSQSLWSNAIGLLALMPLNVLSGSLSDRFGRKPMYFAGAVSCVVFSYFLFHEVMSGISFMQLVGLQLVGAVVHSLVGGIGPSIVCEIFPTRGRTTWMSSAYGLQVALFGGFAPYIGTWLIQTTGVPVSVVYYVLFAGLLSMLTLSTIEETAHRTLR